MESPEPTGPTSTLTVDGVAVVPLPSGQSAETNLALAGKSHVTTASGSSSGPSFETCSRYSMF